MLGARGRTALEIAAGRLQSGHDGIGCYCVLASRTALPRLPSSAVVRDARRNSTAKNFVAPEEARDLVCAGAARRAGAAGEASEESLSHGGDVGTATVGGASACFGQRSALAHVSPFHHRDRLSCACAPGLEGARTRSAE